MNPELSDDEDYVNEDDEDWPDGSDPARLESRIDELYKESDDARDEDTDSDSDWEERPPERDFVAVFAILADLSGRYPIFTEDTLPIKYIPPSDDEDDDDEGSDNKYGSIKRARTGGSEPLETPQLSDADIERRRRFQENFRRVQEYLWEWGRIEFIRSAEIRGESRPRTRKRDRVLAHLRRIALSQSSEEDENWPIQSRDRFRTRLQGMLSEEVVEATFGETMHGVGLPFPRSVAEIAEKFGDIFCVVCLKNARDTMLLPCGHLGTCSSCCKDLSQCPMCRRKTEDAVQVSFAGDREQLDCAKCGRVKDGVRGSCGHLSYCHECDEDVTNCLVCKGKIMRRVKVLWS